MGACWCQSSVADTGDMPQYRNFHPGGRKKCSKVLASNHIEIHSRLYRLHLKCLRRISVLLPNRLYWSLSAMNFFFPRLCSSRPCRDMISHYKLTGYCGWISLVGRQGCLAGKTVWKIIAPHFSWDHPRIPLWPPQTIISPPPYFYPKRPLAI